MIDVDHEAVEKVVEVKSTVKPKTPSKPKKIAKPMTDVNDEADEKVVEINLTVKPKKTFKPKKIAKRMIDDDDDDDEAVEDNIIDTKEVAETTDRAKKRPSPVRGRARTKKVKLWNLKLNRKMKQTLL